MSETTKQQRLCGAMLYKTKNTLPEDLHFVAIFLVLNKNCCWTCLFTNAERCSLNVDLSLGISGPLVTRSHFKMCFAWYTSCPPHECHFFEGDIKILFPR